MHQPPSLWLVALIGAGCAVVASLFYPLALRMSQWGWDWVNRDQHPKG